MMEVQFPDIEQLRAFATAAELGLFSAAGRSLGKAQSATSTSIANLEVDPDLMLFDRQNYRPVLTEHGTEILSYAKTVLDSLDALEAHGDVLNASTEPNFKIFLEDGLLVDRVRQLLSSLGDTFPSLKLTIEQSGRREVKQAIDDGHAHFAFLTRTDEFGKEYLPRGIGFQRLVPVCSRDHDLSKLKEVEKSELARHRQLIDEAGADRGSSRGRKSPNIWMSPDLSTRLFLVLSGIGWSELPAWLVTDDVLAGRLKVLGYTFAQNSIQEIVGVLSSPKRPPGPVARWLRSEIDGWNQRAWIGDHRVGRRKGQQD